ncbi:MAG: hypothetical protein WDN72_02680 [Alphaproteobacteria bacterium]
MTSDPHIGVMGGGAWGTTLAILANRAGSRSTLWTRNEQVVSSIKNRRENAQYLPDISSIRRSASPATRRSWRSATR